MVTTRSNASSSYFGKIPDFFRVYIPESSSQRMILPPAVAKNTNQADFSITSTIRNVGSNKLWHVRIRKLGEYMAFEQGWPVFVRDNSLRYGYFLIFSYNGSSEFHVKVYGQNQCLMRSPLPASDESTDEIMSEGNGDHSSESDEIMSEGNGDHSSESENPYFEFIVKKTHTNYGPVTVPNSFARVYMKKEEQVDCLLKCANNSWRVKVERRNRLTLLAGGWHVFARHKSLKVGQICRFQLIPSSGYMFHVSLMNGSIHPNFRVKVSGPHLEKRFMFISTQFVKKYMNGSIKTAVLKYAHKQWEVKLTGDNRLSFGTGVGKFLKENNFQVGNTCQFELIKKEGEAYVFKVSLCT